MTIIKIILFIISLVLLISGLVVGNKDLTIAGAFIYSFICLFNLPLEYKQAKLYRGGKFEQNGKKTVVEIIEIRFWQGTFIVGVLLMVFGQASGVIIFVSGIIKYFIDGLIAKEVAGIPLEMRYGGWQKRNLRRRR